MTESRIIVSLDLPEKDPALSMLDRLDPSRCRVKVGKELFTRTGPRLIEQIHKRGYRVFLDLKFHDIPNTVARACDAAADLGVWMLNVHASGGKKMLEAAREAIDRFSDKPLLIAVTVLTSLSKDDLAQTGIQSTMEEQVLRLAALAEDCQLDGVVCSPLEVKMLSGKFGPEFKLVTPGIRPAGSDRNDQNRVMTPADAIRAGSHYLVIGRPITGASDPLATLIAIEDEIRTVKSE